MIEKVAHRVPILTMWQQMRPSIPNLKSPIEGANLNFINFNGSLEMGSTRDMSMPPSIKGIAYKGPGFLTVTLRAS
jgi:hypothetical protein